MQEKKRVKTPVKTHLHKEHRSSIHGNDRVLLRQLDLFLLFGHEKTPPPYLWRALNTRHLLNLETYERWFVPATSRRENITTDVPQTPSQSRNHVHHFCSP